MTYLIFNSDDDLIDIIEFKSDEELNKYKTEYPEYHLKDSNDFLIIDNDDFLDDDSFLDYDDTGW